jgi:hypothetical protein
MISISCMLVISTIQSKISQTITYLLGPSDDLHQLHVGHLHHPVQDLTDPAQDILLQAHW